MGTSVPDGSDDDSIVSGASLEFGRGAERITRTMVISSEGGEELEVSPDHADSAESDVCGWEEDPPSAEGDKSLTYPKSVSTCFLGQEWSGTAYIPRLRSLFFLFYSVSYYHKAP